jgi:hypothetical protein
MLITCHGSLPLALPLAYVACQLTHR